MGEREAEDDLETAKLEGTGQGSMDQLEYGQNGGTKQGGLDRQRDGLMRLLAQKEMIIMMVMTNKLIVEIQMKVLM